MAVEIANVTKEFAGLRALDDVSVVLQAGETHALLGANGSGKSTLSKILSGVHRPDSGEIRIGPERLAGFSSPNHANAMGVAVVHQEAPLIDTLSVGECMALFSAYPFARGRIDWRALYDQVAARLARYEVDVDPRQLSGTLSAGQRALVSLVIALDRVEGGLKLLILDEATAALTERQAAAFLDHVKHVASRDLAILMVTHRLAELAGRTDKVTILRDGRLVHTGAAAAISDEEVVSMMAGPASAEAASPVAAADVRRYWALARSPADDPARAAIPALEIHGLQGGFLRDLDLTLQAGEIVGIAGLADSGVQDLPRILSGAAPWQAGEIRVRGTAIPKSAGPSGAIDAGLAVLPADRLRSGGIGTLSMSENVVLPTSDRWWHRGRDQARLVDHLIRMLDVRPPNRSVNFGALSGGNQQKVILGKWLSLAPAVLVLDDPTQGVDPNARNLLFAAMNAAAECGVAIILFSTELDQLALHCRKVFVLRRGQVAACLEGEDLTPTRISEWSYS